MCVCVCVCVRERERERESNILVDLAKSSDKYSLNFSSFPRVSEFVIMSASI